MKNFIFLISILFATFSLTAQDLKGDRTARKSGTLNGNRVKTVFGNWGVIAQPDGIGPRGAWKYDDNGYVGDVSPLVAVEIPVKKRRPDRTIVDTTFNSVVICPVDRPGGGDGPPGGGAFWGFEPIPGYANPIRNIPGSSVAISNIRDTWPHFWPDRPTWINNQGNPDWNGYFGRGITNADQETYFKMDDNADEEFFSPTWKVFSADSSAFMFIPDSTDLSRKGLGLEVKVRALQWNNFLAQDGIFWLYEITNKSKIDYPKVAFGMIVGTYLGISGNEWNDDVSFFDVREDLTYSWDYDWNISPQANPKWQPNPGSVGFIGYAFLESPSNSYDGIDNDGDDGPGDLFTEFDFGQRILSSNPGSNPNFPNNKIVLIDRKTYQRTVVNVPAARTNFTSMGKTFSVALGDTLVEKINNGLDDDLDGLIDENLEVHYKQIRRTPQGLILFEKLSPVKYKNYFIGSGLNNLMIDEARDDGIDNDGDWDPLTDDVGADGVAGTGDFGEGNGVPDPGEPNFDALDIHESDMIGLTSFEYFVPAGNISMANDEGLWQRMIPGFFKVPTNFVNNVATRGEDGDFIYGSGYFPLPAGKTERFSLALFYGERGNSAPQVIDTTSLYENLKTMKQIYNSNYRFARPPEKPKLNAVPGDGRVTLYWDRKAMEKTFDTDLKINDFEGYKIYRSTEPNFNDIRVITDGKGIPLFDRSLAQFDLKNNIRGYFTNDFGKGVKYYLGDDVGVQHSFVDSTVQNGKLYYYAVVAYDRGDIEKNLPPSENNKFIARDVAGKITTDINTASVIPQKPPIGYEYPPTGIQLTKNKGSAEGKIFYNVVDQTLLKDGNKYVLKIFDTTNDGVDNNNNWRNHIKNTMGQIISWGDDVGADGDSITIDRDGSQGNGKPDVGEPSLDHKDNLEMIPVTSYYRITNVTDPQSPTIVIDKSPYIQGTPYLTESKDSDIFDGITLSFENQWDIKIDTLKTQWSDPTRSNLLKISIRTFDLNNINRVKGAATPFNYEIVFFDTYDQWSVPLTSYLGNTVPAKRTNFKIFNTTDPNNRIEIKYGFLERKAGNPVPDSLSDQDAIILIDSLSRNTISWLITFSGNDATSRRPRSGDKINIFISKPFNRNDEFEFTVVGPKINPQKAKSEIQKVKVVPNPYVGASTQELPLPTGITGRGERKITFTNVPMGSKIEIYTVRGEHVITLYQNGSMYEGNVNWNLRNKENLDIAYGIYFFVIDAPEVGVQYGKFAIIK